MEKIKFVNGEKRVLQKRKNPKARIEKLKEIKKIEQLRERYGEIIDEEEQRLEQIKTGLKSQITSLNEAIDLKTVELEAIKTELANYEINVKQVERINNRMAMLVDLIGPSIRAKIFGFDYLLFERAVEIETEQYLIENRQLRSVPKEPAKNPSSINDN